MKKFLIVTLLMVSMIAFVACGGNSSGKKNKNDSDPVNDEDSTEITDDSDKTEPDDEEDNHAEEPSNCTGISIDWTTFTYYSGIYYASLSFGDESLDDSFIIEIIQDNEDGSDVAVGEYDLGKGDNTNYATCSECIRVSQDYVEAENEEESGHYTKLYFQKSGTLKIEKVDDSNNIVGSISAILEEVTIDFENKTYESTPVDGGSCVEIETASFNSGYEEPCVPQCNGKECGNDGCGGACGICDGQACSTDFKCVPFNCDDLEIDEFKIAKVESWFSSYKRYEAYVKDNKPGSAEIPDLLAMTFYTYDAEEDEWSYRTELLEGSETLKSYADDETAILMYEDYDLENESVGKYYVHESGKLNFTKVKEGTLESQGNGSFRVMEVDTDLIQVPGGKCYEFNNVTWDTICVPQCDGKVCGPDGCGGTCGDGCGKDQTCSADQKQCVDFNCTEITIDPEHGTYDDWYGSFDMPYSPNTQDDDIISLTVNTDEDGTYDLYGKTPQESELFFVIYEGYD